MRSKGFFYLILVASLASCGGGGGSGVGDPSGAGGEDGWGGRGGGAGGSGGGSGGGAGGGAGGTGGTGGSGGEEYEGQALELTSHAGEVVIPLHGSVMITLRVDRELAGEGPFHISLDGDAPRGIWLGTSESAAPASFDGVELSGGEDELRLHLFSREVEALDRPLSLRLRGSGSTWRGSLELELRVLPWVTSLDDDGEGSLRDLVSSAPALQENPTITFAPWLISSEQEPRILLLETPIVIEEGLRIEAPMGEDGKHLVIVDGQARTRLLQVGTPERVAAGEPPTVLLRGLQLQRGEGAGAGGCVENYFDLTLDEVSVKSCVATEIGDGRPFDGSGGGLVSWAASTLRIVDSRFFENEASMGGAAMSQGATTVEGSHFVENTASREGGALAFNTLEEGLGFELVDTHFQANKGGVGGAVSAQVRSLRILDGCTFEENRSEEDEEVLPPGGGALYLTGSTGEEEVEIRRAFFRENSGMGGGGAILANKIKLKIDESHFLSNESRYRATFPLPIFGSVDSKGGAIDLLSHREEGEEVIASLEIRRSLVRGNVANWGAGLNIDGHMDMQRCAIVQNKALAWGGGLLLRNASGRILSSTIAENTAGYAGGIYILNGSDFEFAFLSVVENVATGGLHATDRAGPVGGIALSDASLTLTGSIVAKNEAAGDVTRDIWVETDQGSREATFESLGYNIFGDTYGSGKIFDPVTLLRYDLEDISGYTETNRNNRLDPGLGQLEEVFVDGVPTWVAFPQEGGRAIKRVNPMRCKIHAEDQLGEARPTDLLCTAGAVEP